MHKILDSYKYLLKIVAKDNPLIIISTVLFCIAAGLCPPILVWCTQQIIDRGAQIADKILPFTDIVPVLILFFVVSLIPGLVNLYIYHYIEPRSQLTLRTTFRAELIKKTKRLKYEHFENPESIEIIDKAFNRTENTARHLFPMYLARTIISSISVAGCFLLLFEAEWWLVLTVLLPFVIEMRFALGLNYEIYAEMETYWAKEHSYGILGSFLSSRETVKENHLNQLSDYLAEEYQRRQYDKNTTYEKFYFKHLKKILTSSNLSRISIVVNAVILLMLYINGYISLGAAASLTLMIFGTIYSDLDEMTIIVRFGGVHANSFEYYKRFFDLSEEGSEIGAYNGSNVPIDGSIEFKNVWFRYPGTEKYILKDFSCIINDGEKISIVGENGEGKTTMIKLLLGLFTPDRGEIRIGGVLIEEITASGQIPAIFGTVFQDFLRYNMSFEENIYVGDLSRKDNKEDVLNAVNSVSLDSLLEMLPDGFGNMLGRQFENGVDLSGGQWQRIAISRVLFGNKRILILDEPTSQLDPIAESDLYKEFANLSNGKTSLFITHRLGSTAITDRIFVISGGEVVQNGGHEQLMEEEGMYADMFNAQKHWYEYTSSKKS